MASHFLQIPASGPLPERVHGALTTGEFSWGTFVRALAAYADTRGTRMVGGRDVIPLIGRVGVIESVNGSKAFAQLYAALALRHFGADLSKNVLWQSLSADDRLKWKALLDPTRFYDPKTRQVIDLPENYLGVASRVATLSFQMGVITDRAFVDALLDRAAEPFTRGALYADDAGTAGRYDRYSNEYARYVYEAAETVNRQDILKALQPSLTAQSRLWWDLVSTDGYGYNWGRSLGVVSYLDTLEIVAFLAAHAEIRPAPLPDLASEYRLAWIWLRDNYDPKRHMLQVFAPGRGNYAYITKEREWQQNVGFFGKALMAARLADARARRRERHRVPRATTSAGRGAIRVLPPRRSSRRRVAGAPGSAALRAADHERHQAGRRRLSAGAAWPSRIHGSSGTDRSGRRVVLRDGGRQDAGRDRWRRRNRTRRRWPVAACDLAPLRHRRGQDR